METCKLCGSDLDRAWVDIRVGGVFRQLCLDCSRKEVPLLLAPHTGACL